MRFFFKVSHFNTLVPFPLFFFLSFFLTFFLLFPSLLPPTSFFFFFSSNQSVWCSLVSGRYLTHIPERLQKPLQIKLFIASQRKRNQVCLFPGTFQLSLFIIFTSLFNLLQMFRGRFCKHSLLECSFH